MSADVDAYGSRGFTAQESHVSDKEFVFSYQFLQALCRCDIPSIIAQVCDYIKEYC